MPRRETGRPALPAFPAIRWSVSSGRLVELTDQGIHGSGGETRRRLEAKPQAVVGDSPIVLEIAGFYPIFTSALVVVCSGRFLNKPGAAEWWRRGDSNS